MLQLVNVNDIAVFLLQFLRFKRLFLFKRSPYTLGLRKFLFVKVIKLIFYSYFYLLLTSTLYLFRGNIFKIHLYAFYTALTFPYGIFWKKSPTKLTVPSHK